MHGPPKHLSDIPLGDPHEEEGGYEEDAHLLLPDPSILLEKTSAAVHSLTPPWTKRSSIGLVIRLRHSAHRSHRPPKSLTRLASVSSISRDSFSRDSPH